MNADSTDSAQRYCRQTNFSGLGPDGQAALARARALVVGVGGLGSWSAELLARAGVGFLRLLDGDRVDWTNLHRQAMYDESDVNRPKAEAAAEFLRRVNGEIRIEPVVERLDAGNIDRLAGDVDVILDQTDNFPARFLLNDYAVREHKPWVFAGVVRAEGQTMTIVPGRTACLRCVYDAPPPSELAETAATAGVLGPAVAAIAALSAMEALKLLAGRAADIRTDLLKLDLWTGRTQRIDASRPADDCPCCRKGRFEFLNAPGVA
ncbi:MAG TPA: HesA/MoeB/ThiF family protein [Phycisphaerae bacterium]|nr:HesA/MoeB/ThiF family protein [Phycisphaerae bacterium]